LLSRKCSAKAGKKIYSIYMVFHRQECEMTRILTPTSREQEIQTWGPKQKFEQYKNRNVGKIVLISRFQAQYKSTGT
jgi:hypothetical protein